MRKLTYTPAAHTPGLSSLTASALSIAGEATYYGRTFVNVPLVMVV
jgi:hypothetical protein